MQFWNREDVGGSGKEGEELPGGKKQAACVMKAERAKERSERG